MRSVQLYVPYGPPLMTEEDWVDGESSFTGYGSSGRGGVLQVVVVVRGVQYVTAE